MIFIISIRASSDHFPRSHRSHQSHNIYPAVGDGSSGRNNYHASRYKCYFENFLINLLNYSRFEVNQYYSHSSGMRHYSPQSAGYNNIPRGGNYNSSRGGNYNSPRGGFYDSPRRGFYNSPRNFQDAQRYSNFQCRSPTGGLGYNTPRQIEPHSSTYVR
jgi:hypothetical protein